MEGPEIHIISILLHWAFTPDRVSRSEEFTLPTDVNWESVFAAADAQDVKLLCLDGLHSYCKAKPDYECSLFNPEYFRYNHDIGREVVGAEDAWKSSLNALTTISNGLREKGVDVTLLKGTGLSLLYPIPQHRVCGDIDILTSDFKRSCEWFEQNGARFEGSTSKHTSYTFGREHIELHRMLFNCDLSRYERRLEKKYSRLPGEDIPTKTGAFIPSPLKNYLFVLRHTTTHFSGNRAIRLRQLLDVALLARSLENGFCSPLLLNPVPPVKCDDIHRLLKETKLLEINSIILSIAKDVAGIDNDRLIFSDIPEDYKKRMLDSIMQDKYRDLSGSFLSRAKVRAEWFRNNKWKYRYLPTTYFHSVLCSISNHLSGKLKI